ncbi:MAG: hypothetical protein JWR80_2098 [Bradyrhizobium sp.]|nr:hypothetical protein [Bradyrhizobium sp.]
MAGYGFLRTARSRSTKSRRWSPRSNAPPSAPEASFDGVEVRNANGIIMAPLTRVCSARSYADRHYGGLFFVSAPVPASSCPRRSGSASGVQDGHGRPASGARNRPAACVPIVDAVHEARGRIVAQLRHMGRVVHLEHTRPRAARFGLSHPTAGRRPFLRRRAATAFARCGLAKSHSLRVITRCAGRSTSNPSSITSMRRS